MSYNNPQWKRIRKIIYIYICIWLNHFVVHQKLTQNCNLIIFQKMVIEKINKSFLNWFGGSEGTCTQRNCTPPGNNFFLNLCLSPNLKHICSFFGLEEGNWLILSPQFPNLCVQPPSGSPVLLWLHARTSRFMGALSSLIYLKSCYVLISFL